MNNVFKKASIVAALAAGLGMTGCKDTPEDLNAAAAAAAQANQGHAKDKFNDMSTRFTLGKQELCYGVEDNYQCNYALIDKDGQDVGLTTYGSSSNGYLQRYGFLKYEFKDEAFLEAANARLRQIKLAVRGENNRDPYGTERNYTLNDDTGRPVGTATYRMLSNDVDHMQIGLPAPAQK